MGSYVQIHLLCIDMDSYVRTQIFHVDMGSYVIMHILHIDTCFDSDPHHHSDPLIYFYFNIQWY